MKRLILILVILAALLGLSLYGISYARQTRDSLGGLAAQAIQSASAGSREALLQAVRGLEAYWKTREPFLSFYVRHDELEKINACLSSLQSTAAFSDPSEALSLLSQLLFFANHLYERELPGLNNLF